MRHELLAVADAQHARTAPENSRIDGGAGRIVNAIRTARDNQALRPSQIGRGRFAGADLGVNPQVANFTRNQVAVLAPGIQYDDLSGGFHLAIAGSSGCKRLTRTLRAESTRAFALGMASMARSTSGSPSMPTRSLSSMLKAVMYISRLSSRVIQSVSCVNSASVKS